ncbi:hypothetical protein F5884DRAFT_859971 [Xylogone sp. PMI_703]|nr:hypothetical protein F5884DRAFT_859971 [Xylogone sp. PMI_703]
MTLVALLNGPALEFSPGHSATMERRALEAIFGVWYYTAATDGAVLQKVRMQEAADLVTSALRDGEKEGKKKDRLVLVAQDRHEVYLLFPRWNKAYLDYLRGVPDPVNQDLSFVTVRELGPWRVADRDELEELAQILLAIILRAVKETDGDAAMSDI